jgi:hypothetical protein
MAPKVIVAARNASKDSHRASRVTRTPRAPHAAARTPPCGVACAVRMRIPPGRPPFHRLAHENEDRRNHGKGTPHKVLSWIDTRGLRKTTARRRHVMTRSHRQQRFHRAWWRQLGRGTPRRTSAAARNDGPTSGRGQAGPLSRWTREEDRLWHERLETLGSVLTKFAHVAGRFRRMSQQPFWQRTKLRRAKRGTATPNPLTYPPRFGL